MRVLPALLALATLPALAQAGLPKWSVGVHQFGPTLEGHMNGIQDGKPVTFDLKGDLGLDKDKITPGGFLEYQGPRFGLTLSMDTMEYKGAQRSTRTFTINGVTFQGNVDIASKMKNQTADFNWTIRVFKFEQAWIGVDLGAHSWKVDVEATGKEQVTSQTQTASQSVTLPIPQIGASAGFHLFEGRLVAKASYHMLNRSGAKYTRTGADVRFFPLTWLGVRAYMDNQTFDVPKGSVKDDLELKLDRNGVGFGIVARW